MLSYNCMQKGTAMARAGKLEEAMSIMKGCKRGMQKNLSNAAQSEVYKEMNNQIGDVYSQLGE